MLKSPFHRKHRPLDNPRPGKLTFRSKKHSLLTQTALVPGGHVGSASHRPQLSRPPEGSALGGSLGWNDLEGHLGARASGYSGQL